jgi:hypothetical protein
VVHPQGRDDETGRCPLDGIGDHAHEVVAGRNTRIADIDGAEVHNGGQEMAVGVDEPREDGAA